MRKDDHTMTVVTGLVLAVGIGIVAERTSGGYGGPDTVQGEPVADRFMLRAGVPAALDVLSNDGKLSGPVQLTKLPDCGVAEVTGDTIQYSATDLCTGSVSLAYCVGDAEDCVSAPIALTLQAKPEQPTVVPVAEPTQKFASLDDEDLGAMTSHGKTRPEPEFALIPTKRIEDASLRVFVATMETPAVVQSVTTVSRYLLDTDQLDLASAPTLAIPQDLQLNVKAPSAKAASGFLKSYAVATWTEDGSHPLDLEALNALEIASAPEEMPFNVILPAQRGVVATAAEAQPAPIENIVTAAAGCDVSAQLDPAPGAHVGLSLSGPCLAAQPISIKLAGLEFAFVTSADGTLYAELPVLAEQMELSIDFGDLAPGLDLMATPVDVPHFERGIVRYPNGLGLAFQATEQGDDGTLFNVVASTSATHQAAVDAGRGYVRRYASTYGRIIEVYTLPLSPKVSAKSVAMSLVREGPGFCAGPVELDFGFVEAGSAVLDKVKMPVAACASNAGFALGAGIGPIVIASQ